jgi:hypothetical protein
MERRGTIDRPSAVRAFKRRLAFWCLIALPSGCGWGPEINCGHVETLPSNRPGSGVECGLDAGVGAAGLTGTDSFVVASATQSRVVYTSADPDPNEDVFDPGQDAGLASSTEFLTFALYEARRPCRGSVVAPATSRTLSGLLFDYSRRFEPGSYPIAGSSDADPGRGAWFVCITNEAGSDKRCATTGTVEILRVTDCSLSGTLDLEMGDPGERPLRGIFTATYCR